LPKINSGSQRLCDWRYTVSHTHYCIHVTLAAYYHN
jgi:hypothetical protein